MSINRLDSARMTWESEHSPRIHLVGDEFNNKPISETARDDLSPRAMQLTTRVTLSVTLNVIH